MGAHSDSGCTRQGVPLTGGHQAGPHLPLLQARFLPKRHGCFDENLGLAFLRYVLIQVSVLMFTLHQVFTADLKIIY